ncbi:uncharacterized protein [Nicotiana tomentosiformis]|uniref:uncharacterized protein n=1 Tax=Nicotiana tomentosiformis TaxID=4098 RepID=UPI00388C7CBD
MMLSFWQWLILAVLTCELSLLVVVEAIVALQGNRGPSSSEHHNSGQIYATTPVCQTCGRSHLGQCRVLTGECFRCVQLGHHLRDCPQPPRNFNQASIQLAAPTQTTRNTLGATVTGNKGVLSVCSFDALALIDPGSTHSYVSLYFALKFSRHPELLNEPFLVATPVGESLLAEYLSSCYAIGYYHSKIVKFEIPNEPSFVLKGGQVPENCKFVSFMKAQRLLKKGCLGLIAIVNDTRKETVSIENVPVVREFSDVFPEELPRLPPVREIDFGIDLPPHTQPISIPPYRMALAELKELKQQLQDLLDKGFIRPSISP